MPDDLGRLAVPGQQADAGPIALLPAVGERRTRRSGIEAERHREIEQDDGALGDGAVMHAHRPAHGDAPAGAHPRLRVHDRHLDVVAPAEEIGDGVELPRQWVALRVRRVAAFQRAAEIAGADRLELVAQLVGACAGLHDGEGASRMADDVGVGREVHAGVHRPRAGLLAERTRHLGRAHPTVPVPLGAPVTQPDPVHHPVTGEPVVGRGLGGRDGIRPVAEVAAGEGFRYVPGDGQLGRGDLFEHGREIALQVRIGADGHGCPLRSPFGRSARARTAIPGRAHPRPT